MNAGAGRLRILVLAGRVPWPLSHGGRLRLHHFLRVLSRSAAVTLVVPNEPENGARVPPGVALEVMSRATAMHFSAESGAPSGGPMKQARRFIGYDPRIGGWLHQHARAARFDVALLSGTVRGIYAADIAVPCVWDSVDDPVLHALRDIWRAPSRWFAGARSAAAFALYGRTVARHVRAIVLSSEVDARSQARYARRAPIHTISNGVDADTFAPLPPPAEPGVVAFVGSLSFSPNIDAVCWFARRVWPKLYRGGWAKKLLVVGKSPAREVAVLASMPGVEIAADVADVRPFLARASVVVVPMRKGGGVKNKILEACAAQRAVVASPVAAAGLSARAGRDMVVASTAAEWQARIQELLENPLQARAIADAGRKWVVRAHDWTRCGAALLDVLSHAAGAPPRTTGEGAGDGASDGESDGESDGMSSCDAPSEPAEAVAACR